MWTKFSIRPFPRAPRGLVRFRTNSMAIAIELVRNRTSRLGARGNGLIENFVHIFYVDHQAHRTSAKGLRTTISRRLTFVRQHDRRITDLDLGMHDRVVGPREAHQFGRAECLLVKLDGPGRASDDQVGGY